MAKIIEGVFAINKPQNLSSADVVRDVKSAFEASSLFAPMMDRMRAERRAEGGSQRRRRRDRAVQMKVGHGGTLDPLATGVLVIGVGRGTKHLQSFLACTKSYRATMLFGAATDTYDVRGRVLAHGPTAHLTRSHVDRTLRRDFTGDIMQLPPIYSALSQDGKRLYEYAREGKEPPRKIEKRPVRVDKVELVQWLEPGEHPHQWPADAPEEEKAVAKKVLEMADAKPKEIGEEGTSEATNAGAKRKREDGGEADGTEPAAKRQQDQSIDDGDSRANEAVSIPAKDQEAPSSAVARASKPSQGAVSPAAVIDMTVTSGFYVRSLCHDLGKAVGSAGLMATLVRSRQGDYALGENVLEYEDLGKGEGVWGPKVKEMLEGWQERNPPKESSPHRRQHGDSKARDKPRRNSSSDGD